MNKNIMIFMFIASTIIVEVWVGTNFMMMLTNFRRWRDTYSHMLTVLLLSYFIFASSKSAMMS